MRILVLGASGMLGSAAFRGFAAAPGIAAFATARSDGIRRHFAPSMQPNLITGVDVLDTDALLGVLAQVRPDAVVNCIGVIKQLGAAKDPLIAVPLNTLLPHRLARAAALVGARLVHVSTDCVFRGTIGNYTESMLPDAEDLYGRSKLLGEVDYPNAVTLRTSIIGREVSTRNGLVEWFLGAENSVRGFTRAIFSGLPTNELVRVIIHHVLPHPELCGVWHVGAAPISKHDLLLLLREAYGRTIEIVPDPAPVLDRSLDSSRFRAATGYTPPDWMTLIEAMRACEGPP
ncbi:MAG TPA: SDR family oxidoreductase [Acetobacteraceae bacterium]|nr:SDR family oxidoreductase [Acetobacteraceae bacterium]